MHKFCVETPTKMYVEGEGLVRRHVERPSNCRGGLVGYDASFTRMRSGVRLPSFVTFRFRLQIHLWV